MAALVRKSIKVLAFDKEYKRYINWDRIAAECAELLCAMEVRHWSNGGITVSLFWENEAEATPDPLQAVLWVSYVLPDGRVLWKTWIRAEDWQPPKVGAVTYVAESPRDYAKVRVTATPQPSSDGWHIAVAVEP